MLTCAKSNAMREFIIKYFGRILAILGCSTVVTACYGVPFDIYSVKGRVIDAETEEPIKGIKVQVRSDRLCDYGETDADGSFHVGFYETAAPVSLECVDVDGPLNGSYESFNETIISEDNQYYVIRMVPKK